MKILVTGSNGLVGQAIRRVYDQNTEIVFATREDADLTDFVQAKALFEKVRPTHVLHAAAKVAGIGGNMSHPGEYFRDNLLINVNTLEAARLTRVSKLLTFLSTCIYPDKAEYPLKAEVLHLGPPHPSNFGYAHAKRMIDVQSRAYRKEWGCNFITVVGTNLYGPNDNFSLENGHVLPSLIHKCYLAKKDDTDFNIWGSGAALREFVLSDDIGRLALWALMNYEEESPLMLTSGIETSIKELALLVAKKMGFKGNVVFDTTKSDGQLRKPSDPTKMREYLPDFMFTSVEQGVEETVNWFMTNYPNVRK